MAEHRRPEGWGRGYFCANCGAGGLNMYGNGHTDGYQFSCVGNPELVLELLRLNGHSQPQETTDPFAHTKRRVAWCSGCWAQVAHDRDLVEYPWIVYHWVNDDGVLHAYEYWPMLKERSNFPEHIWPD
jgi:hypothetical protein